MQEQTPIAFFPVTHARMLYVNNSLLSIKYTTTTMHSPKSNLNTQQNILFFSTVNPLTATLNRTATEHHIAIQ